MATERLLRMVESKDTSTHLAASSSVVVASITRSRIGLPYLVSPVCKNGVSRSASMKLVSAYVRNSRTRSPRIDRSARASARSARR